MPQMGVSVAEGTVVEWKKRVGDWVEADEPIVEISTDKVETEVPSPATGRVVSLDVEVGVTVDVGTVLATIDTGASPGEAPPEEPRPPISPVVRRIAAEHGVDLSRVNGTGRLGRVTKKDVLAFIDSQPKAEPVLHIESPYREEPAAPAPGNGVAAPSNGTAAGPPAAAPEPPARPDSGDGISLMRRKIGEHMRKSLDTAAHCTTIVEADMSAIEAARGRLSYLPFLARAVIAALREYPSLNSTWQGDSLVQHEAVNLGIAVSLGEDGLIVPVVQNA